jgi:hypothetical protein
MVAIMRQKQNFTNVPDTSMRIKIIYISVQSKSIGNIQKYWGAWRGVLDYIEIIWQKQEKWR